MTITSVITAQSIGTGSNKGNSKFATSALVLQSTTTAYVVNVQVTPGAGPVDHKLELRVWFTTTPRTVTAGNAPYTLGQTAHYVDIRFGTGGLSLPSVAISKDSALEPVTGGNLHVWCDVPGLDTAATLDVSIVELP